MIEKKDVTRIAYLARLRLSDEECGALTGQLDSILDYVHELDRAPTQGVEPTCYVVPPHDPLRDDVAFPSLPPHDALANGPSVKKGFFTVPKVINQ